MATRKIKGVEYELLKTADSKSHFLLGLIAAGEGCKESDLTIRKTGRKWGLYIKKSVRDRAWGHYLNTPTMSEAERSELNQLRRMGF